MKDMIEYRHILKDGELLINKGQKIVDKIGTMPLDYIFTDSYLYKIGVGEIKKPEILVKIKEITNLVNNTKP